MLQEGNASRERLNEFNDLIYCFILYTVYTLFTFDETHGYIQPIRGWQTDDVFVDPQRPDHNFIKTGFQGVGQD